uniref:Uncharacterized protein n=1 Tax=Candidatus Kentrum sp. LFY TaxID=2126342 RepID=A0A450U9E8_9GAMM|nr:MAG: hypothetical protein BECKLFY1418B_GA0070995_101139 [Candidatus Kentron sp. LFY]
MRFRFQIKLGLWQPKRCKTIRVFQLCDRRNRFGELVQVSGSPHDWFEGRGTHCTLIVFIDNAIGQLVQTKFVSTEITALV